MVDTNHEDGRSYISAVSEVIYDSSQTCEGNAKVQQVSLLASSHLTSPHLMPANVMPRLVSYVMLAHAIPRLLACGLLVWHSMAWCGKRWGKVNERSRVEVGMASAAPPMFR